MECIKDVKELQVKIEEMRQAQKVFSTYSQEQVDTIFRAVAAATISERIRLARLAAEEMQIGIVEDKAQKNQYAAETTYTYYRNLRSCGIVNSSSTNRVQTYAEPVSLIGGLTSVTSPTANTIIESLLCVKTRNAVLFILHEKAKRCTYETAQICAKSAYAAGTPKNIIGCLQNVTDELRQNSMDQMHALIKANSLQAEKAEQSYANCPVIIQESAKFRDAVCSIIQSKTFDAGLFHGSEQAVIAVGDTAYRKTQEQFSARGGYVLNPQELTKLRHPMQDYF